MRVPWRALECGNYAVEIRLTSASRHRGNGGIRHIHTGFGRLQNTCCVDATGIVGVEVNRDADCFLERFHQFLRRKRTANARHVLDRKHVRAHFFQLLRELHVIAERIFVTLGVEDIAGVADRAFADRARLLAHGFHRHNQIGRVVKTVENTKDVHAAGGGVPDEAAHNFVGVIRVTDGIAATEEHLEADVGDALA